jgi:DNA-entry nuclease
VGICFNVYCYNVQPGIEIDYATGDSCIAEEQIALNETTVEDSNDTEEIETMDFVINTNTKKFHLSTCSSVSTMAEHNKKMCRGTVQEVINEGYEPCQRCLSQYK